jgi:hypothetical protein
VFQHGVFWALCSECPPYLFFFLLGTPGYSSQIDGRLVPGHTLLAQGTRELTTPIWSWNLWIEENTEEVPGEFQELEFQVEPKFKATFLAWRLFVRKV